MVKNQRGIKNKKRWNRACYAMIPAVLCDARSPVSRRSCDQSENRAIEVLEKLQPVRAQHPLADESWHRHRLLAISSPLLIGAQNNAEFQPLGCKLSCGGLCIIVFCPFETVAFTIVENGFF